MVTVLFKVAFLSPIVMVMTSDHSPLESSLVGISNPIHVDALERACVSEVFVTVFAPLDIFNVQVPLALTFSIRVRICRVEPFWFAAVIEASRVSLVFPLSTGWLSTGVLGEVTGVSPGRVSSCLSLDLSNCLSAAELFCDSVAGRGVNGPTL